MVTVETFLIPNGLAAMLPASAKKVLGRKLKKQRAHKEKKNC